MTRRSVRDLPLTSLHGRRFGAVDDRQACLATLLRHLSWLGDNIGLLLAQPRETAKAGLARRRRRILVLSGSRQSCLGRIRHLSCGTVC
ncbi:hypothetical protein ASF24_05825 [Methylobacterium sp. Leaf86]|nr:hypothetical protein ASF24_05825 [Methylobacterium sp. Leaf86]